jgi:hypothetical protein
MRLEFKGREALQDLASISREVVALLNARGGEVWIGIEERDGRAVAVQGIREPEREQRRLRDHLVDSIAPSPLEDEVGVTLHSDEAGNALLVVEANPRKDRRPYAFLKGGGWHFLVRVGDRVRPMSREEILRAESSSDDESRAIRTLHEEKTALQKQRTGLFWVRIQPLVPIQVPLRETWIEELLKDPRRSGNRPMGWNFAYPSRTPTRKPDRLVHGEGSSRHTEILRDGGLSFRTPVENLHWKGSEREIWPYVLLELPVSLFRLAAAIYKRVKVPPETEVAGDLAIFGLRGWTLRPGSPQSLIYRIGDASRFEDSVDFVREDPLELRCREILEEPDKCAVRLVARVYEAFGYGNDDVPREFDWDSGRLLIPE